MRGRLRKKPERELPLWLTAPATSAEFVRTLTRAASLDPRLVPTDRHLQRWAAGQGSGLPNADAALLERRVRLDPLPLDEATITDQVIIDSPSFFKRFATDWYRSRLPAEDIAQRLGLSREKVFVERRIVLAYYLGRLTEAGIFIATFEPGA